jgi:hypothetical protein
MFKSGADVTSAKSDASSACADVGFAKDDAGSAEDDAASANDDKINSGDDKFISGDDARSAKSDGRFAKSDTSSAKEDNFIANRIFLNRKVVPERQFYSPIYSNWEKINKLYGYNSMIFSNIKKHIIFFNIFLLHIYICIINICKPYTKRVYKT